MLSDIKCYWVIVPCFRALNSDLDLDLDLDLELILKLDNITLQF